jgi:hypothetical protein
VRYRDRTLPAHGAGTASKECNRDNGACYLLRFTRQVPVCGALNCEPRVV